MEVVLNASIAGGVALGGSADLINSPYGAMLVGFVAGIVSGIGFLHIGPLLKEKIGLHDTCGVHNLHGMPGIVGGIVSSIAASFGNKNFG